MKLKITHDFCNGHMAGDFVDVDMDEDENGNPSLPGWAVGKAVVADEQTATVETSVAPAEDKADATSAKPQNPDPAGSDAPKTAAAPAKPAAEPKAGA